MWRSNFAFSLFNLFLLTVLLLPKKIRLNSFYCYLKDGLLLEIIPNQTKPYEKPKPTYFLTYYDPNMIISYVQMKAKTLTHLQTLFLLPHMQMKLESQDTDSLRSFLSPYKLPFGLHTSTSLQTTVLQSKFSDPTKLTFLLIFQVLINLALLCKLMKM